VTAGPLHIAPNQFGFVFSEALVGLMLGAFGLGPIADRYGRRCVLIYATATFGVFTLCTASAATLQKPIALLRQQARTFDWTHFNQGVGSPILHLHDEKASRKWASCSARRLRRTEFSYRLLSAPKMAANHRALRRACQLFSRAFRVLEARSRTAPRRLFRYLPRAFEKQEQ
jgi:hypothetical protein